MTADGPAYKHIIADNPASNFLGSRSIDLKKAILQITGCAAKCSMPSNAPITMKPSVS